MNSTTETILPDEQVPWNLLFAFFTWQLWLAPNARLFTNTSISQSHLVYKSIHLAIEFYHLACPDKFLKVVVSRIIKWLPPLEHFIKLNSNGSSLDNPRKACANGILHSSLSL